MTAYIHVPAPGRRLALRMSLPAPLRLSLLRLGPFRLAPSLLVTLALAACTSTQVDVPPAQVKVPPRFRFQPAVRLPSAPLASAAPAPAPVPAPVSPATAASASPADAPAPALPAASGHSLGRWWRAFNDPVMTDLIERGLAANRDIRIALNRVREARAYRTEAESAVYPQVAAGATAVNVKSNLRSTDLAPIPVVVPPISVPVVKNTALGFGVAWEVDLFGARRSKAQSVAELEAAAREQVHGTQLLVAGEIAAQYFEARGIEQRQQVLQRGIAVARRLVQYADARYRAGQAKHADLLRAQAEAGYTESQGALLHIALRQRLHKLATLTGQVAGGLEALPPLPAGAAMPEDLPRVLPAEALENRPDVRGAAYVLRSRAAELGEARADLLPRFYLGFLAEEARVKTASLPPGRDGIQAWGAGLTLPIFTAGRLRAEVKVRDARLDTALAEYERAMLQALDDVETAYAARLALDERERRLADAVQLSQQAAQQTERLYRGGQELLQPALEAMARALQREDELVQTRIARATTTVLLYKAIGSGWSEADVQQALADAEVRRADASAAPPRSAQAPVPLALRNQRRPAP